MRIVIVGCSGSGKTTLARAASARLGVPHLELDSVFHQPGWTQLSEPEFQARVRAFLAAQAAWVIDGNYSPVRDLIWAEATDVVWLHPPRPVVMRRIILRTLRRTLTRETLWNGNKEPLSNLCSLDPERSIIAWAWTRHGTYGTTYAARQADPRWAHARQHKLTTAAQADRWLSQLPG
jgi:adenylate kinase family enzyme